MAMPVVTMRDLFEAGVHFGHHTRRRNPKMDPYLFGARNSISIINLEHSVPLFQRALQAARDVAASGGRILFVGTKRQASEKIAESAKRSGQYYVNHRWLGGMLTNWKTVSRSIKTLRDLETRLADPVVAQQLTKKELLSLTRAHDKLERALGGIKDMGGVPDLLFVVDIVKEDIAVLEALKLGIPVIGIADSNCDPTAISYPIPGNDDAIRAIELYCNAMSDAILDGMQAQLISAGIDVGESLDLSEMQSPVSEKEMMTQEDKTQSAQA